MPAEASECGRVTAMLEQSRPFSGQSAELVAWLAKRVTVERFAAGQEILCQDTPAEECFILGDGAVELLGTRGDGSSYRIAQLASGEVVGAEALVTATLHAATARAITPVEALRVSADDFVALLAGYPDCAPYFFLLARQRSQPRQAPDVVVHPAPDDGAEYILKHRRHHRYLRLLEPAYYLWSLMDGEHTVRDLSVAYYRRYRRFAVDEVLATIASLRAEGFIDAPDIDQDLLEHVSPPSRRQRLAARGARAVRGRISLADPDRALTAVYHVGFRVLYTWPIQAMLAVIALVGFGLFLHALAAGSSVTGGSMAFMAFVGIEVQIVLHEVGHALTTKHFGREVHKTGIGWYLFLPVAFVDTSDMWLERRWRRATVAAAGPYVNFILAGVASCLLPLAGHGQLAATMLAFASTGYVLGTFNLNPLYELDGYYVLSDLLGIPNLRSKALSSLGAIIWRAQSQTLRRRERVIYVSYGTAAVGYAVLAGLILLLTYHRLVQQLVARVLPAGLASRLGWMLAAVLASLLLLNLWQGLCPQEGHSMGDAARSNGARRPDR